LDERNLSNKYHDIVLFRLNRYLLVGIYYLETPITSVLSVFSLPLHIVLGALEGERIRITFDAPNRTMQIKE